MSLRNPIIYGDNVQRPSANAELYVPDQLIAGDFKLVTDDLAVLTGGAALKRGTVLGRITLGAALTAGGVQATGTLTFSGNPAAADTITLNGTAVTFVANGTEPVGSQVELGLTEAETIEALMAFLIASTDTQLVKFQYSASGQVITLAATSGGTGGNSLTVAESSSVIVASGGTLAGGASNTGNGTFGAISLLAGGQLGAYVLTCIQATTGTPAATSQPKTGNIGTGAMGTVTPSAGSFLGEYQVILTGTGATAAFKVVAPNGSIAGTGAVGTAYNTGGLSFTLANGGTMTAGDTWLIFVTDNGVSIFSVTDPHGVARPNMTVGTAYANQIGFTLSQGGTKFVVGDSFTITVQPGAGAYKLCVATANDGSQAPAGILADDFDATGGDVPCGVYETGEFNGNRITFDPSWSLASVTAAARKASIFIKTAITSDNPDV